MEYVEDGNGDKYSVSSHSHIYYQKRGCKNTQGNQLGPIESKPCQRRAIFGWGGGGAVSISVGLCTESIKHQEENVPIILIDPQP